MTEVKGQKSNNRQQKSDKNSLNSESERSKRSDFFRFITLQSGFTLVEVLISLAILSTLAIMTIPNIRNFNRAQEIRDSQSNLLYFLTHAQSKAVSSIQCSDGTPSIDWTVRLRHSSYDLGTRCWTSSSPPDLTPKNDPATAISVTYPPGITMSTTSCGTYPGSTSNDINIVFENSLLKVICFVGGIPTDVTKDIASPIEVELSDTRDSPPSTRTISIDKGGAISLVGI